VTASRRIGVLNAGAGSLKTAVLDVRGGEGIEISRSEHEWPEGEDAQEPLERALASLRGRPAEGPGPVRPAGPDKPRQAAERDEPDASIAAIGHRVVHGGAAFTDCTRIDDEVAAGIEALIPLAPLHNTRSLEIIRAARRAFPDVPHFAVFDTAFHARRPQESMTYALPARLAEPLALKRYGFHGIAHASMVEGLAVALGVAINAVTAVTLQLGSGSSACAVDGGRSVETSMGYTPLEGLVMTTRSGDIDPAIVVHLARRGFALDEIEHELTRNSGLRGLTGLADVRDVLAREAAGDPAAALALAIFVRRMVMTIGAYLTLLEGRGAIAFGGGIGTHSVDIRRRVAGGLAAWNVALDDGLNDANEVGRISREGTRDVFIACTNEESVIAREIAHTLDGR
jgi:acetate kinase